MKTFFYFLQSLKILFLIHCFKSFTGSYIILCNFFINNSFVFVLKVLQRGKHQSALAPYIATDGHPNVLSIHEIILGESSAYIFFPRGYGDLHSYVREKKKLKQEEARELANQVVKAVCHCHENGVVLRDLKLRKFVFTNEER